MNTLDALRAKGLNIAQTREEWVEMNKIYHPEIHDE